MGIHVFFMFLYLSLANTLDAVLICSLLILHCIIKLVIDVTSKRGLHIMTTFYFGVIFATFANLLFINKIYTFGLSEYSMYRYIVVQHIDTGILIWALGNTFIFIGYELFANKSFPSLMVEVKSEKAIRNLFGFILFFSFLNVSGNTINLSFISGGVQKVIALLNVMGILFFARLWGSEDNAKYRNFAFILAVLQTLTALFSSFLRLELLTPTIVFYGGYFIGKGSIKYVFTPRIVPPLIIMVIFSLFFNTLAGNRSHFIDTFTGQNEVAADYTSYVDMREKDNERGGLLERSSNIAQITNVVDLVERNGIYGGQASAPLIAAFIPRILWPDKPQVQLGAWFALEIGAASITASGRANNSVNMTVHGELYLDFGWLGIVLGGIMFGGLIAAFWNAAQFNESAYNVTGALWGGYLLYYALFGVGSDLQILVSLVSTYLMFMIIKSIAKPYENSIGRTTVARQ